jgi:MYXO-CTERM domain-containing protein
MGDLMTCEYFCGGSGTNPITQKMLLRGNVMLQGMPANHSQLIALYNDEGASTDGTGQASAFDITLEYNTIIGDPGVHNAVVHHRNDVATTSSHLSDNVITNFESANLIEAPTTMSFTVDGSTNWVTTGTNTDMLTATLNGADPMLSSSYVPLAGSPLVGAAMALATAPTLEYLAPSQTQPRATANDIGAFESGTSSPVVDAGAPVVDAGVPDLSHPPASEGDLGPVKGHSSSGCGCRVGGADPNWNVFSLVLLGIYLARARRRSPEKVCASTRPSPLP